MKPLRGTPGTHLSTLVSEPPHLVMAPSDPKARGLELHAEEKGAEVTLLGADELSTLLERRPPLEEERRPESRLPRRRGVEEALVQGVGLGVRAALGQGPSGSYKEPPGCVRPEALALGGLTPPSRRHGGLLRH